MVVIAGDEVSRAEGDDWEAGTLTTRDAETNIRSYANTKM